MDRIFSADTGTQLLVIQHLRNHLDLPKGRDFLIWCPGSGAPILDDFMKRVISTAGFKDTLDIRSWESHQPRTEGALTWCFESIRRLRCDAEAIRSWMRDNQIRGKNVEIWIDEPYNMSKSLLCGLLRGVRCVKIPHCFNHEDCTAPDFKRYLMVQWKQRTWLKQFGFLPWQRCMSGVDLRMERVSFERGYTFDAPSPWSTVSIDLSRFICIDAFRRTYEGLPLTVRKDVDAILDPIRQAGKPLLLLLLFGLGENGMINWEPIFRRALMRIFSERSTMLENCTLAIKLHPVSSGVLETRFVDWAQKKLKAKIFPILHPLNLEFMLPYLQPDYILAGPDGALPILKRLKIGNPIILTEVLDSYMQCFAQRSDSLRKFVSGIEIW
jgi:hypothetical protein